MPPVPASSTPAPPPDGESDASVALSPADAKPEWTSPTLPVDYPDAIADRQAMQSNTCIRALPGPSVAGDMKTVIDMELFEQICRDASTDHTSAATVLAEHAAKAGDAGPYVEFAKLCFTGPVGHIGSRRALRVVGMTLLDKALFRFPNDARPMVAKGEALLPQIHSGKSVYDTPYPVLTEAFNLFNKAASLGSMEGLFLKGRWLLTMSPAHRCPRKAAQGKADVIAAASHNLPRALVFLAQCYEFPGRFSKVAFVRDLPKGKMEREQYILRLYQKAANLGSCDALNDVGSSHATGYAGLPSDFDKAATFYVRAIQAGSVDAISNLALHYETGMSGGANARIDMTKALHYYKAGVRVRCQTCTHNLANLYEEGIDGVLAPDIRMAENLFRRALLVCDDENDTGMVHRTVRDLAALHITALKMADPDTDEAKYHAGRLEAFMSDPKVVHDSLVDVEKAILHAVNGVNRKKEMLAEVLGTSSAERVAERASALVEAERKRIAVVAGDDAEAVAGEPDAAFEHVFGSVAEEARKPKRSRRTRNR